MNLEAQQLTAHPPSTRLGKIHTLLTAQTVLIILISINRLSTLTTGYVLRNGFLRWVDLNNMLTLPIAIVTVLYLLKQQLESSAHHLSGTARLLLDLTFVIGVYLLGAGYGNHEVTNYLHARFCPSPVNGTLCQIVVYNDDTFSHLIFFVGFMLPNIALMFTMAPHPVPLTRADRGLLAFNGLFVGGSIFANLAFEQLGLDLYVVALLAIVALTLLHKYGRQPLLFFYAITYSLGLVATVAYKAMAV